MRIRFVPSASASIEFEVWLAKLQQAFGLETVFGSGPYHHTFSVSATEPPGPVGSWADLAAYVDARVHAEAGRAVGDDERQAGRVLAAEERQIFYAGQWMGRAEFARLRQSASWAITLPLGVVPGSLKVFFGGVEAEPGSFHYDAESGHLVLNEPVPPRAS